MSSEEINAKCSVEDVRFAYDAVRGRIARVSGVITDDQRTFRFRMVIQPRTDPFDGEWQLVDRIHFSGPDILAYQTAEVAQQLINFVARVLKTTNVWPGEQSDRGGKLVFNEQLAPQEVRHQLWASFRFEMVGVPSPPWRQLWPRIRERVRFDPWFKVNGFDDSEVNQAVDELELCYPDAWVKRRYRKAGLQRMADPLPREPSEMFFPAYHLARTATGMVCVDPGWAPLVEDWRFGNSLMSLGTRWHQPRLHEVLVRFISSVSADRCIRSVRWCRLRRPRVSVRIAMT